MLSVKPAPFWTGPVARRSLAIDLGIFRTALQGVLIRSACTPCSVCLTNTPPPGADSISPKMSGHFLNPGNGLLSLAGLLQVLRWMGKSQASVTTLKLTHRHCWRQVRKRPTSAPSLRVLTNSQKSFLCCEDTCERFAKQHVGASVTNYNPPESRDSVSVASTMDSCLKIFRKKMYRTYTSF